MEELNQLKHEIQHTFRLFTEKNDEALAEVRKHGQASASLTHTVDALNQRLADLEGRQKDLQARAARPTHGLLPGAESASYERDEVRKGFERFLRTGDKSRYQQAVSHVPEFRGLSEMADAEGGVFVAPHLAAAIAHKAHNAGVIRSVANVVTISTDMMPQPIMGTAAVSWTTENAAALDQTLATERVNINVYEMKALVKLSNRLLEDSAFDIQAALGVEFSRAFAEEEDYQFATGSHPNKPGGVFANALVQANQVKTGVANSLTDATHNGVDAIIDLQFKPKAAYHQNGCFLMNSKTEAAIRKLKDSNNRYLWQPATHDDTPPTLLGSRILIVESAPDIGANTTPIVFGDFSAGYQIVDRIGLTVQFLDQLYAITSQTGFLARKRVGGEVVLPEAFACLKVST